MNDNNEPKLSVDEFVDYCRTQAGLLAGDVETMGTEADELLDEIDETIAEIRMRLGGDLDIEHAASPPSVNVPSGSDVDISEIEELESDLETKQALVEAKQARIETFQDLATGYVELAEELQSTVSDGEEAMKRVIRFEADEDAPVYFDDRQTVYEAAATDESDSE
jgi:predicted nuclease with TOPRIM domain